MQILDTWRFGLWWKNYFPWCFSLFKQKHNWNFNITIPETVQIKLKERKCTNLIDFRSLIVLVGFRNDNKASETMKMVSTHKLSMFYFFSNSKNQNICYCLLCSLSTAFVLSFLTLFWPFLESIFVLCIWLHSSELLCSAFEKRKKNRDEKTDRDEDFFYTSVFFRIEGRIIWRLHKERKDENHDDKQATFRKAKRDSCTAQLNRVQKNPRSIQQKRLAGFQA